MDNVCTRKEGPAPGLALHYSCCGSSGCKGPAGGEFVSAVKGEVLIHPSCSRRADVDLAHSAQVLQVLYSEQRSLNRASLTCTEVGSNLGESRDCVGPWKTQDICEVPC